jgi:hypothetical protein
MFVIYIRVICKVTLSSPCVWACFHPPPILLQWYLQSNEIFIKSHHEMLKLKHLMHKVRD